MDNNSGFQGVKVCLSPHTVIEKAFCYAKAITTKQLFAHVNNEALLREKQNCFNEKNKQCQLHVIAREPSSVNNHWNHWIKFQIQRL